ncbi:MAG: putative toxin-antitoxin system toxin component, PIN family [Alphaproteobacteria bacterium]
MTKRVILDTNVHVSAMFAKPSSTTFRVLKAAYQSHEVFQTPETIAEIEATLSKPRIVKRLAEGAKEELIEAVRKGSEIVMPDFEVDVSPDPDDNKFFALAEYVGADFIISRDKDDVLFMGEYKGTRTVSPYQFVSEYPLLFDHAASPVRQDSGYFVETEKLEV